MVLGPAWRATPDREFSPAELQGVSQTARGIGKLLAKRLDHARELSTDWSEQPMAQALVDAAMSQGLARLAETECWGKQNAGPSLAFWEEAGSVLEVGWLQNRARFKPCGYGGDYLMLAALADQRVCEHPLGRLFDRYFLDQAAPQAVRSRYEQIAAAIVPHVLDAGPRTYRIASVMAGPARDLLWALQALPEGYRHHIELVLLDLDENALAFAVDELSSLMPRERIITYRENLFRLAARERTCELFRECDFLVCSGLFDYLADTNAQEMLALFWRQLRAGGEMLVGNFAPHCPTRAYIEWIGNWYLIYRTAEQMAELAKAAGISDGAWSIGAERLGVDLFLHATK